MSTDSPLAAKPAAPAHTGAEMLSEYEKDRAEGFTPEVCLMSDLKASAKLCPICASLAVVPLTRKQRAAQPDSTTHVCHPTLGGCNQGFGPSSETFGDKAGRLFSDFRRKANRISREHRAAILKARGGAS